MFLRKNIVKMFAIILSVTQLAGCGLMEEEHSKYELTAMKSKELVENTFYVKDGTNFYSVYSASGTGTGTTNQVNSSRILWMMQDEVLVPTLYKGEVIAYSSSDANNVLSVSMERYKDIGYSIGVAGSTFNENTNQDQFTIKNVIEDSSAYDIMSNDKSDDFAIVSVNGENVSKDMFNSIGTFTCMEKNKTYDLAYYSGTYYEENTFTANVHTLQSYEFYTLDNISQTKNGYVEIKLPDDLKTGWYYIGGSGLFKYIDHEKDASTEPEGEEWNEAYYDSAADKYAYAQKYSISFDKATTNAKINLILDSTSLSAVSSPLVIAQAPDGTEYNLTEDEDIDLSNYKNSSNPVDAVGYSVTLEEAMAGKWYVYISPKSINVLNLSVSSSKYSEAPTEVDQTFSLEEDLKSQTFSVIFSGEGTITGVVMAPDGTTYNLAYNKDNNTYEYAMDYLSAGVYTVKVYHYTDTDIKSIEMSDDLNNNNEEIVSVTE